MTLTTLAPTPGSDSSAVSIFVASAASVSAAASVTSAVCPPRLKRSVPACAASVICSRLFCCSGVSVTLLRAAWPAVRSLAPALTGAGSARTVSVE